MAYDHLVDSSLEAAHRLVLRLKGVGREVRTLAATVAHAQPGAHVAYLVAPRDHKHDHVAARLDAVAGGEFVDDRIRLVE
jgi:hypothetical protein